MASRVLNLTDTGCIPMYASNGNTYIVGMYGGTSPSVYKGTGTEPTSAPEVDSANKPTITSGYTSTYHSACTDGTVIYIVYGEYLSGAKTQYIRYAEFNTSTDTWTTGAFAAIFNPTYGSGVSYQGLTLAIDVNGDLHILFSSDNNNMGTAYASMFYSNNIAGWKTPLLVTGSPEQSNANLAFQITFYTGLPVLSIGGGSNAIRAVWLCNALDATSFSKSPQTINVVGRTGTATVHNDDYVIAGIDGGGANFLFRFASGGTWTSTGSWSTVDLNAVFYHGGNGRAVAIRADGSRLLIIESRQFNSPIYLWYTDNEGASWTGVDISTGVTGLAGNPNLIDASYYDATYHNYDPDQVNKSLSSGVTGKDYLLTRYNSSGVSVPGYAYWDISAYTTDPTGVSLLNMNAVAADNIGKVNSVASNSIAKINLVTAT